MKFKNIQDVKNINDVKSVYGILNVKKDVKDVSLVIKTLKVDFILWVIYTTI